MSDDLTVRSVGPEDAATVLGVIRAAFGAREPLDPPTDALGDTIESTALRLARGGGLVAEADGAAVGTVLLDPEDDTLYLRRFGVVPAGQGHGVARALVREALVRAGELPRIDRVTVLAREELPRTLTFWQRQGFGALYQDPPYVELSRAIPRAVEVPTADAMRELGRHLASRLRAGDVIVLSGELGAGKTTFTQGLGEGLGVRGGVTSPTFVISRVHPPLSDGPALVHVDAYRLHDGAELDDLDLDASLEDAVTVVEWGEGLAEALSDDPLHIRIVRDAADAPADPAAPDPRQVIIDPCGARWLGVAFASAR